MYGNNSSLYFLVELLNEMPSSVVREVFDIIKGIAFVSLACTVLLMIFVLPQKRRGTLNPFFRLVADFCNFSGFVLEYILKAVYIFVTLFLICLGFVMLTKNVDFWVCLIFIVVLPAALRVTYELMFLFVKLVRNVMQINRRLEGDLLDDPLALRMEQVAPVAPAAPVTPAVPAAPEAPVAPAAPEAPVPPSQQAGESTMVFCAHCGTQYDSAVGGCPNGCGN